MNIQLHHVASTITGVTGMKIIRAIVAGERNPDALADMRDVRCKESLATIRNVLGGNYQPEHIFALKQALALYDFYQQCIDDCDAEIERTVVLLNVEWPIPATPLPKAKHRIKQSGEPSFDVRTAMYQLAGTDVSRWRTAKHFTSWLTLSPGCKISGGKVLSAHTRKARSRVTVALRLAAVTVGRSNTALEAFYRRLKGASTTPRRVPRRRARLPCCSITLCDMAWTTLTLVPITMSNNTGTALSSSYIVARRNMLRIMCLP
ncbi:transposase [Oxalobacteraceae bacterium R-40]|uniref:Transposase n=1 Tax=Keguizhuia sedimenti TaxID=3064264 RepID=A0ABU1BT91_9BURK|nr:transposase [Oxalobacteraceae bacterium R-40]